MNIIPFFSKVSAKFGFSDKLGPLRYETNQEEVFLGHSVAQQRNISDERGSPLMT